LAIIAEAMPIYEYRCRKGHTFEVRQAFSDDPVATCEVCGASVSRVFRPVAVHFKGSGFYNTDYGTRKRSREMKEAKEGSGSDGGKDSAGSSSASDSAGSKSDSGGSKSDSGGSKSDSAGSKSDSGGSKSDSGAKRSESSKASTAD
jgi:putative FmdB family regulatory protein